MDYKWSIIPNHIWNNFSMVINSKEFNDIKTNFDVIELWDEETNDFEKMLKDNIGYFSYDISLSPNLLRYGYDLTSIDKDTREKTICYIKNRIAQLSSIGIIHFSISSPSYKNNVRDEIQLRWLYYALYSICSYAKDYGVQIGFESFDRRIDKCRLIGNTYETKEMFSIICESFPDFSLIWDMGHFFLEEHDYLLSLNELFPFVKRIHLSNYSLKKGEWFYGDKHLPFDNLYGEIGVSFLKDFFQHLKHRKYNNIKSIAFEVARQDHLNYVFSSSEAYNHIVSLVNIFNKK